MKLTKRQLKKIIREEKQRLLKETRMSMNWILDELQDGMIVQVDQMEINEILNWLENEDAPYELDVQETEQRGIFTVQFL